MVHQGNTIARIRGFRQIPQKDMAARLNMSQQEYSRLESKDLIDDDILEQIASELNWPVDFIKEWDNTSTIQTVHQHEGNNGNGFLINKNQGIAEMYERLLQEKDNVIRTQRDLLAQKDSLINMFMKQS